MNIKAVIPVRAGSRRLANKNILNFGSSNLLIHKIRQLKQVPKIDEIIVSTDSDIMIDMAKSENVSFQNRPIEYCDEKTKTFNEVVEYVASNIDSDILIWAPCVCPIVKPSSYSNAIDEFLNLEPQYDSIISVQELKEYIYGEGKAINFTKDKHVPSQELPNWYTITNGFFIAKRQDMINWRYIYGDNPKIYELSKFEAVDIDDQFDFEFAEFMYKKYQTTLL